MDVLVDLEGGRIVQGSSTDLLPDTGHIHVFVDGTIVSMTFGEKQQIPVGDLPQSRTGFKAEFVAADHRAVRTPGHRQRDVREGGGVRRLALRLVTIAVAPTWLVTAAAPAGAHAAIESTDPANSELLEEPPSQIVLTFTEPPDLDLTIVSVVDSPGAKMPTGPPERAPGSNREIHVRLDPVPDGVYTVTWRTVSTTDGHVTSSAFSFGVGVAPGDVTPISRGRGRRPPRPARSQVGGCSTSSW